MPNKKIIYDIGFNVDDNQLNQLRSQLDSLQKITQKELKLINPNATREQLRTMQAETQNAAKIMGTALEAAFNPKLNTLNITTFNKSLSSANMTIKQMETAFANAGVQGKNAFISMTQQVLTAQRAVKQTSGFLDSMAKTLGNTIKWTIASGAVQAFTGSIRKAWDYTKQLDESLNNIRIVTGASANDMEKFAKQANKAAKALGASTTSYTNAALIFYQQGLDDVDVKARTEATIKAANVTGQSAAEVSEQLTAVWNGYKVVAEEAESYVDKLAAVAATTAADLEELSTGMSKVASSANAMGINVDQLSAQLSTIISVTRQDASVVGTALKTIYARMGDLEVSGVDEFGTSLGDVSGKLQQMGIDVLDQKGNLRDMGTVIEEVAAKWGTWTEAQQQAAAVAIAGKRQYNNLIALFENWDMYESSLLTSQGAEGTLEKQNEIYQDSLEARLQKLQTAKQGVYDAVFNSESMKDLIDMLTVLVDGAAGFINSISGGGNLLLMIASSLGQIFNTQIAGSLARIVSNFGVWRDGLSQAKAEAEIIARYSEVQGEAQQKLIALKAKGLSYGKLMNAEEDQQLNAIIDQTAELEKQKNLEEDRINLVKKTYAQFVGKDIAKVLNTGNLDSFESAAETIEGQANKRETNVNRLIKNYGVDKVGSVATEKAARKAMSGKLSLSEQEEVLSMSAGEREVAMHDLEYEAKSGFSDDPQKAEAKLAALKAIQKGEEEYEVAVQKTISALQNLSKQEDLSKESKERLSGMARELAADHSQLGAAQTVLQQESSKSADALRKVAEQAKLGHTQLNILKNSLTAAGKSAKQFFKQLNTKALLSGVVQVTSALGNLGSMAMSLSNIADIWNDDSLEPWQKWAQTLSAVGSAVGMFAFSMSGIGAGIEKVSTVLGLQNTLWMTNRAIKKAATAEDKEAIALNYLKAHSETMEGKAVEIEGAQYKFLNGAIVDANGKKATGVAVNFLNAASEKVVGEAAEETGEKMQIAGNKGFFAWLKMMGPIGWIIAAVVAVIAIVVSLIGIFGGFEDKSGEALRKAKEGFERAKEAAASLNEELKKVKEEYSTMLESVSKYEEAEGALAKLKEGTEEWNEAVYNLNQQVLDLLQTYPMLAEYISSENGVMTITDEGLEKLKQEQLDKVSTATRGNVVGQITMQNAKRELRQAEAQESLRQEYLQDRRDTNSNKEAAEKFAETGMALIESLSKEDWDIFNQATTVKDLDKIQNPEFVTASEEMKEALLENKVELIANNNALLEQTNATSALEHAYLLSLGEKTGDAEVFANLSKSHLEENALDMKEFFEENAYTEGGKHYDAGGFWDWHRGGTTDIGDKVDTLNDRRATAKHVNSLIEQAYGKEGDIDESDLKKIKTDEDFRSAEFTIELPDGTTQKVTGADILAKAAANSIQGSVEAQTADVSGLISTMVGNNINTDLAYFMGGYSADLWEGRTRSEILAAQKDIGKIGTKGYYEYQYTDENGKTQTAVIDTSSIATRVQTEIDKQYAANKKVLTDNNITSIAASALDSFSEKDRDTFKDTLISAKNGGRYDDLLNVLSGYQDNPDKFVQVATQAAGVDFSDKFQAAGFFFKYTEDIQTKIRKQELDYFKTINAELEKTNKLIERAIGLEKQNLLNRQMALEQEAQAQAQQNADDARQILDTYLYAHGDTEKYLNENGSLNVAAVNNRIAELDEDLDATELEYLNNILEYWDKVAETEKEAEEAFDKVMDAQIAAYEYQYEAMEHLLEISRKFKDFYFEIDLLSDGFNAFMEENVNNRLDKAFAVWSDNNAQEYLDKIGADISFLNPETGGFKGTREDRKTQADYQEKIDAKKAERDAIREEKAHAVGAQEQARENYSYSEAAANSYYASYKEMQDKADHFTNRIDIKKEEFLTALRNTGRSDAIWYADNFDDMFTYDHKTRTFNNQDQFDSYMQQWGIDPKVISGYTGVMDWWYYSQSEANTNKKLYEEAIADKKDAKDTEAKEKTNEEKAAEREKELDAEIVQEEAAMKAWAATSSSATFANALGIDMYDFLAEDGSIDFAALEEEIGKEAPWLNPLNGEVDTSKLSTSLEEDFDTSMEKIQELKDSLQEMYDIWLDAQEQLMELYDEEMEKLSSLNSILESSADLWKIIGNNSDNVNAIYAKMTANATESLSIAKTQLHFAQIEYKKVTDDLGDAANAEMIETTRANLQSATENVLEAAQTQMDAIAKQFSASLQSIFDGIAGGSLEGITEQWDLHVAKDERYLDSVNETYAIDQLNKSFEKSIDETDNIAAKNKLLAKQAQIEEKLKEIKEKQVKLTQADLDRANAEYELTLKQIALEEAQQTANKMKLTRDANGNYTYQYVSDEDAIAQAEAELAEAENNLYNQEKDRTKELVSEYYATMSEANQAISEAVAAGDEERVERLKEYYGDLLGGIQAELNTSSDAFEELGGEIENWTVPFTEFTEAIANTKFSALFSTKEGEEGSITKLVDGLFGENGTITSLKTDLTSMLGEEGLLGVATTALGKAVKDTGELAVETGKLVEAADEVVANLPDLTETVNTLVENLKGYTTQYKTWLEQQNNMSTAQEKAILDQTKAIKEQTIATLNLIDAMDGEINGKDSLDRVIVADGYSYNDGGWIANDLDISGNETK